MILRTIREAVEQVTKTDLKSKTRQREVVYNRSLYFKLARKHTRQSLTAIGNEVNKNHATVLHGLKLYEDVLERFEPQYIDMFRLIEKNLKRLDITRASSRNILLLDKEDYIDVLLELRRLRNKERARRKAQLTNNE